MTTRNAEATRERILEAAMAEFSAYGIAGARVDRIAKNAGCNKNMIYIYFENKETLFTTILQKHLTRVYEEIAFTPDDLPGYAVRVFDFAISHPDLMRLMAWFNLEQKADSPAERGQVHDQKVKSLTEAQNTGRVGSVFPPEFILTTIMTIATAWTAANPFGPSLDPKSTENVERIRDAIFRAVRVISLEGLQS
ncbi:TetR family transcriptional regulator [Paenibacillus sp. J22TS3]|uniref:TetR family transcriptional regulator n=1 Tax=Paenibacillus sp. J22TS3 TaxID=2807192 RepID=UPI001B2604F8|nr:TetR family transcriptional regulator [Paenibacillus sp. J22TS3]GIP22253.1 putative TetR family regulatory protein [Paenibacillus sp. J22TS3]